MREMMIKPAIAMVVPITTIPKITISLRSMLVSCVKLAMVAPIITLSATPGVIPKVPKMKFLSEIEVRLMARLKATKGIREQRRTRKTSSRS
jgi:hypothetical protein